MTTWFDIDQIVNTIQLPTVQFSIDEIRIDDSGIFYRGTEFIYEDGLLSVGAKLLTWYREDELEASLGF